MRLFILLVVALGKFSAFLHRWVMPPIMFGMADDPSLPPGLWVVDVINKKVRLPSGWTLQLDSGSTFTNNAAVTEAGGDVIPSGQATEFQSGSRLKLDSGASVDIAETTPDTGVLPGGRGSIEVDVVDPAGSTANQDVVLTTDYKLRVVDVTIIKGTGTGVSGDTVTVDNGTGGHHITEAIDLNTKTVKAVVRVATLDATYMDLAAGATIRVAVAKGTSGHPASKVLIHVIRVP